MMNFNLDELTKSIQEINNSCMDMARKGVDMLTDPKQKAEAERLLENIKIQDIRNYDVSKSVESLKDFAEKAKTWQ